MAQLPSIYVIQASDAPQHTGKLQEILQGLKAENRIENITTLGAEGDLSSVTGTVREGDLVLIMLTSQLESRKDHIESRLRDHLENHPNIRVVEIIVDHVIYDNTFIAFPADLRPIRDREDMDEVWSSIEQSLKELFPVVNGESFPWKKYAMYGALLLLAAVIIWGIVRFTGGPEAQFTYYVGNADQDTIAACYAPCDVQFINESQNFESSQWTIEDTVFNDRHLRLEFMQPGDKEISLTVFKNSKKNTQTKSLLIKPLPFADFEIKNNGCTAPCRVEFANTSANAVSYSWDFGNGQVSQENQPAISYTSPNEYQVTLTAINEEGMTSETKGTVTIIPDESPFADFSFSGNIGTLPRQVTFSNKSQNADSYVWRFPGGRPSASGRPNPTVTYQNFDSYSVTLIAQKDGRSHQMDKVVSVRKSLIATDAVMIQNLQINIDQ